MSNYTVLVLLPLCSSLSQLAPHYRPQASGSSHPRPGGAQAGGMWAHDLLGLGPPVVDDILSIEDELDCYLAEPLVYSTALYYWQVCYQTVVSQKSTQKNSISQENQTCYPTLFRLAMDILPIQGSAVPCERVFSSAKETMTISAEFHKWLG